MIALVKQWKILATGYRARLAELPTVIHILTNLEFYRLAGRITLMEGSLIHNTTITRHQAHGGAVVILTRKNHDSSTASTPSQRHPASQ